MSEPAAIKLVRRVRQTGSTAPARISGFSKPLLSGHEELLRELVTAKSHIILAEIKTRLTERGIETDCLNTIWSTLLRLGLSHKNSLRAVGQNRPDVAEHRRMWRVWQRFMDPERFVFIDENGAATNMVRRYSWAPRGERLVTAAPNGHWRATTFVAGSRNTGLVAQVVLDGPVNGLAFLAYVEQFLAPTLRRGDVVVMENLAAHKVAGVAEAIRVVGASILYLPPYSPDLNPIEQAFSKLEALLRATAARIKEALWTTIGQLLDQFSPDECRNYLANSGYKFT